MPSGRLHKRHNYWYENIKLLATVLQYYNIQQTLFQEIGRGAVNVPDAT